MTERIATAEWADPALVEEKYLYRDGTVWLGRSASDHGLPVGYTDDRHVCVVSGSRGGKGTTSIVNNLILWPGSICVIDPKGENATITASRRGGGSERCKGLGQAVQVLDPFKAAQVDDSLRGRFNPLDALDPDNDETIDEAGRIADAVVVVRESHDPFWDESARSMVKGLILHVLTAPKYEGRRNLITVRKLIMRGDWEAVETLREAGERENDIPPAHGLLWAGLANNPAFDGLVAGLGDSFTNMLVNGPKQYESVLQVANRNTEFIDSPPMQYCLEASDFQLSELKTRPGGLSVYLCLPQRYMNTHYRWLRMMIALTVTEMEKVRGRPATGYPVLMVLDEFAGLKRMEVIENAVAQIAGYGVKLFFVLQSLEQLKAVYKDNWETFLANSGLKVFFNLEDHFSREYVSKLIGETEVIREVRSSSDSFSESESVSRSTGRSTSTGVSETAGTNRSVNTGKSWGVNDSTSKSWGASWGTNWTPGGFWGHRLSGGSDGRSVTQSKSHGTSRGWTEGESHGTSRSTAHSRTDGTSSTEGTTHGTSQSRTAGMSETVHKRALVTPDEIGHLFARIDDKDRAAYPGLALVVISGARPMAVRRVTYFEDACFARRFEPHPDYGQPYCWKDMSVSVAGLTPYDRFLSAAGMPVSQITGWLVREGQIVSAGEPLVSLSLKVHNHTINVLSPRAGMIVELPELAPRKTVSWLFSITYHETEEPETYPFPELLAFVYEIRDNTASRAAKATRSVWMMAALGLVSAIGLIVTRSPSLIVVIGIATVLGLRKMAEVSRCKRILSAAQTLTPDSVLKQWNDLRRPMLEERPPVEAPQPLLARPQSAPADAPSALDAPHQEISGDTPLVPEPPLESTAGLNNRADGEPVQPLSDPLVEGVQSAAVDIGANSAADKVQEAVPQPLTAASADTPVSGTEDKPQEAVSQRSESEPQMAAASRSSSAVHTSKKQRQPAMVLVIVVAAVILAIASVIAVIKSKTGEAEQAAVAQRASEQAIEQASAAQRAAERAAGQAAEQAAKETERAKELELLLNKQSQAAAPRSTDANIADRQSVSDRNTSTTAPANPPAAVATAPPRQSTVPAIDPNDNPIGAGGFIHPFVEPPQEIKMVRKVVQVCVPSEELYYGWDDPRAGSKIEAFRNAARKAILEQARSGVDDHTQFRVLDVFQSFDPANPGAQRLVTVLNTASGANSCLRPDGAYTLTVDTKP